MNDQNYNLNVTGTSGTFSNLTPGTTYKVRVSAHNTTGYGMWTDPATSVTTTTSSAPSYSADRHVWCVGDPSWAYASTPGWAFAMNGYNALSSNGWVRDSEGNNPMTPQRVYYDDSAFPNLMSGVSSSYGQNGKTGPCKTVAVRIDGSDPQVPGILSGAQGTVLRLDSSQNSNPFWGAECQTKSDLCAVVVNVEGVLG